ncbi:amidohydrolase family protein [Pelagibacterium montanilacus]|uniref:amidohydrolase family protein n=1 Tax=Pelagibacterium montanilacus TaxID=2185280 RepID=UPI000F8DEC80|nr:amidohydrolase family protein [Pelagibacterium montanilacus]
MIDAHLHFWDADHAVHDWPDDVATPLRRGFAPADLEPGRKRAGVRSAVLMQSRNDAAESIHFADLAARNGFIGALVGWVDLTDPDGLDAALDQLAVCGKLRGIRHLINFEPDPDWLRQDTVKASIARLADRALVLDLVPTDDARFDAVLDAAARHPGLSVVVDHMGRPPVGAPLGAWGARIRRAASLPNVAIKLSVGLDVLRGWRWDTDALRPYADHLLDCFGASRVMAASNWPVVTAAAPSYEAVWQALDALVAGLSLDERRAVMGRTAARIFDIRDAGDAWEVMP